MNQIWRQKEAERSSETVEVEVTNPMDQVMTLIITKPRRYVMKCTFEC